MPLDEGLRAQSAARGDLSKIGPVLAAVPNRDRHHAIAMARVLLDLVGEPTEPGREGLDIPKPRIEVHGEA